MDALRKQASKLKEQVAKQQQAVIKQFSGSGYESSDVMVIDEIELQRHQQLDRLYKSTRTGKDFQKDIVRAAEGFTAIGCKHIEIGTKLSEDCCKYGVEGIDGILAKAASLYGEARANIEKEQADFNRVLSSQLLQGTHYETEVWMKFIQWREGQQSHSKSKLAYQKELLRVLVLEPLRAMILSSPLEDARHLAQRYSRMRHDAEAQAAEVSRRKGRARETPPAENAVKLQAAESKMHEIKANMAVLGKEAAAALAAVEAQQQRLTLQRLIALVEVEKDYHLRVAAVLDMVEAEMVSEKQRKESTPPTAPFGTSCSEKALYFLAEVKHAFDAGSEKELSLEVGDYVVVRQVTPSGWSEGECRGKAGWFPSAYVERCQKIPANKVAAEVF